jgi:hypothetical protein
MNLHYFVPSACRMQAIFLMGKGARANKGGAHDGGTLFGVVFVCGGGEVLIPLLQIRICVLLGDPRPTGTLTGPRQLRRHRYLVTICCLGGGSGF